LSRIAAPGTALMVPEKRIQHIALLRPEICTIDLNTMNSGKEVVINTPAMSDAVSKTPTRLDLTLFAGMASSVMTHVGSGRWIVGPIALGAVAIIRAHGV
jgi:hypothetical protein